jgi:hypothetical protein
MASVKCAAVLALATALAGCCGWERGFLTSSAITPSASDELDHPSDQDEEASRPAPRSKNRRQVSAPRMPSADAVATNTRPVPGAPGHKDDAAPTQSFKPLTPEWWAAERAKEDRLRKSIIICSNCLPPAPSADTASRTQPRSAYDHDVARNEFFLRTMNSGGPRAAE